MIRTIAAFATITFAASAAHAELSFGDRARLEREVINDVRERGAGIAPKLACSLPSPLPVAPPVGAYSGIFSAAWTTGEEFRGTLWREPCPTSTTSTTLYLRIVPTQGAPFVCSSSFKVVQAGTQYDIKLVQTTSGGSFCSDVFAPVTLAVDQYTFNPQFDRNGAFTLIYSGVRENFSASFPAYAGAPPPGPPVYTPIAGLWWYEAESGSGYALDVKHGVLVMTVYSYTADGAPIWYLAAGPIVNNVFTATLDKYRKGQCISCPYPGRPESGGNDGTVTVTFTSNTTATMTLPGGRSVPIVPQPF